jgi:hypothetical protein
MGRTAIGCVAAFALSSIGGCLSARQEAVDPASGCLGLAPVVFDFGVVAVGAPASGTVVMSNTCAFGVTARIAAVSGPDAPLFTSTPGDGDAIALAAHETRAIAISYSPRVVSPTPAEAELSIASCQSGAACTQTVALRGRAVAGCLAATPTTWDFGVVLPGEAATQSVTLTNLCQDPVQLTSDPLVLELTGTTSRTDGAFQQPSGQTTHATEIAPGKLLQMAVVFMPPGAGQFEGEVDVSTDDPQNATLRIPLSGVGAGAQLVCSPLSLDFGLNAVGITSTLSVLCTNEGQSVTGHPEPNLFIPDPRSASPGLVIENGDTAFQPAFDRPFPRGGLAPGQTAKIDVTYAPTTGGADADTLIISSNDSIHPTTRVSLAGTAKVLPDCDFVFNPANPLAFGHVDKGNDAIMPFDIVNNGTDSCGPVTASLTPGSCPDFSLIGPSGPTTSVTCPGVGGGESCEVQVQYAPTNSQSTCVASLCIDLPGPQRDPQCIPLSGSSLSGCLLILPNPVDFGTVSLDAGTKDQAISVRIVCDTQDVTLQSISLVDSASPPEFFLSADPSPVLIPKVCAGPSCPPPSPVAFQVSFRPYASGPDTAKVKLFTTDLSDPYIVSLQGDAE